MDGKHQRGGRKVGSRVRSVYTLIFISNKGTGNKHRKKGLLLKRLYGEVENVKHQGPFETKMMICDEMDDTDPVFKESWDNIEK